MTVCDLYFDTESDEKNKVVETMDSVFQAAIAGYGKSAKNFHLPLLKLHRGFKLRSVYLPSSSTTRVDEKGVMVVRSLKELLKDDKVDIVIITSPNRIHFEQAKEALSADKHVVVEKPVAVSSDEAEELIRLAEIKQKILTVFHNRRGDADFLTLKKTLNDGALGELVEIKSTFHRHRRELRDGHWKESSEPGSGILYDLSPHLIDQSLILFGKPNAVYADIKNQRGGDTDDSFDIKLYYDRPTKLEVTLSAGMLVADPVPRFIARGAEASLVIDGKDAQESALTNGQSLTPELLKELAKQQQAFLYQGDNAKRKPVEIVPGKYPQFYDDLYHSITKKWEPPVKPETAKRGLEIVEAAIKSSKSGKRVKLD